MKTILKIIDNIRSIKIYILFIVSHNHKYYCILYKENTLAIVQNNKQSMNLEKLVKQIRVIMKVYQ